MEEIFFNRDELHVVRSVVREGKEMFCSYGRLRFTVRVILSVTVLMRSVC